MPKFNDNQPDPRFWSARRLLIELGKLVPNDPEAVPYQALATLWARNVERQTTFRRAKVKAHKPRTRRSDAPEAIPHDPIIDATPEATPEEFERMQIRMAEWRESEAERERERKAAFDNSVWATLIPRRNSD